MELSNLFALIRRWAWLLVLSIILGVGTGYVLSQVIPPEYAITSKILVTRTNQDVNTEFASLTDQELVQTFIELLSAQPVLDQASEQLDYEIDPENITIAQITNSQVIQITVEDTDIQRGMDVANAILDIFILELNEILTGRYTAMQNSLELQIAQVEVEMNEVQDQIDQITNENIENQLTMINTQIQSLEEEIDTLNAEIESYSDEQTTNLTSEESSFEFVDAQNRLNQLESTLRMYRQMDVILSSAGPYVTLSLQQIIVSLQDQSTSLQNDVALALQTELSNLQVQIDALPLPLSEERREQLATNQAQLDQLESIVASFQEMQVNLAVLGSPNQTNSTVVDSRLQRLHSTMNLYEEEYLNLTNNLNSIQLASSQSVTNITQIEPAAIPDEPVRPLPLLYTSLSGVIGVMLAAMFIGLVEALDNSIKSPMDIINIFGLPVIGDISAMNKDDESERWLQIQKKPFSSISEEFRVIQTTLQYTKRNNPPKTLLVTSIGKGVGKTTVATNLTATYSKGNRRVILLDLNSRNPKIHEIFGLSNNLGVSDIIIHDEDIKNVTQKVNGFSVITHGLGDIEGHLKRENIAHLIKNLENDYDFIVIDSPSMGISDTQVLASEVDGVLLVVKPETSKKETAWKARDQILDENVELLGVVFNRYKDNLTGLKYIRKQLGRSATTIGESIRKIFSKRPTLIASRAAKSPSETESVDKSENQYPDLLEGYKQNMDTPVGARFQSVRLLKLGKDQSEIEEITGCNKLDLMAWEATYNEFGIEALGDENGSGPNSKLSLVQRDEIKYRLQGLTPREVLGDEANTVNCEYWTIPDLTKAVKKWYGVEYQSRGPYYEIFRYSDFVYYGMEMVYKPQESETSNGAKES